MTRQRYVMGNWKMQGSKTSIQELLIGIKNQLSATSTEVAVFPPFVYLEQTQEALQDSHIKWGAQNAAFYNNGAYTGEISVSMLQDFACSYVLVGHSERRALFGESNDIVAKKFLQVLEAGLTPVLCLGETLDERNQGKTQSVILAQLQSVLDLGANLEMLKKMVIAYEPVWAIGTGLTATPEQAQEVHNVIRQHLKKYHAALSGISVIYGGSVKANNAAALFAMPDIDGALVGGASLDAKEFCAIVESFKR